MLSFLLLPGTCGTSTFGARDVSPGEVDDTVVDDAVIEAPRSVAASDDIVEELDRPGAPADSSCSSPLFGFASLAAQPARMSVAEASFRKGNAVFNRVSK